MEHINEDILSEKAPAVERINYYWLIILFVLMLTPIALNTAYASLNQDNINFGDHAVCRDVFGDQFDISVINDSYENGIFNVTLLVKYQLVDKSDEGDQGQVTAATEVFLGSSYLQNDLGTVQPISNGIGQGINSTLSIADKSLTVNISFQTAGKHGYTLVVPSYPDINNLTDKQLQEGMMRNLRLFKFALN